MATLQGFGPEGDWIREALRDGWVDDASPPAALTPIAWDNLPFSPPDPPEPYLRFSVQHSGSGLASLGTDSMRRYDGMVVLEIFVPAGTQTATLDDLCDSAAAIFRDARTDGLRFYEPRMVRVGPQGAWFKKDVLCPFQRDTVFS